MISAKLSTSLCTFSLSGNIGSTKGRHPFVDFFHTLSVFTDVECAGLGSHTIRWLMKVVVVPSVLFLIAGLYYAYDVHKERQTAFMQFKSNAFFIVFFTCKSVLRLSGALLVMYRILNAQLQSAMVVEVLCDHVCKQIRRYATPLSKRSVPLTWDRALSFTVKTTSRF